MTRTFTRRQMLKTGVTLAGGAAATGVLVALGMRALETLHQGTPDTAAPGVMPWTAARGILNTTVVPTFPSATFDVTSFGARGDGKTDNTRAFQMAIATCNSAGGGHVLVPAGTYSTGAICLKSSVDLHLNSGATLLFNGNAAAYPPVLTRYEGIECLNHSPMIYAFGETNLALTGSGTLDASGTASWNRGSDRASVLEPLVHLPPLQRNVVGKLRSAFVEPYQCTNVLIQGVTLRHSIFWQVHPTLCTNVTVDGVTTTVSGANTDGCDPECCDHVVIKNCTLGAGDDNIAIKSGRDDDGRLINTPCQNLVIWNNRFEGPWGAISLGSELTGGIENVYAFSNSTFGTSTRYMLYVKSNTQRGGFVRNIHLDTFHGLGLQEAVVLITMTYYGQTGDFPPDFSGPFNINHVAVDRAPMVLNLEGLASDQVGPVNLSNSTFTHITTPTNHIRHATKASYTNVTINGQAVQ